MRIVVSRPWESRAFFLLLLAALICFSPGGTSLAGSSEIVAGSFYAVEVSETGICANSNLRCDPSRATGSPDGGFVSLGGEGYIVAELGSPIVDGPGSDLRVYEIGGVGNVDAEGFDVYISTDGNGWIKIGSCIFNDPGRSYASIDISGHSGAFGYVKVVDCWTEPWTGSTTGADIDAIEGLYTVLTVVAGSFYAVEVSETGICVNSNLRCDPSRATGSPDGGFVSLGGEGYIVAEFGSPIVDGPGSDLRVYEIGGVGNVDAEGFDVYISTDGNGWIKIGSCIFNDPGRSYASIDISGHSGAFGYVKVVDCWTEPWTGSTTGADIDAIEGLYTVLTVVAGSFYAVEVSETGICVNSNLQCDPSKAEGSPDGVFVSLGGEGYIVAELESPIVDGPGPDLRVYEIGGVSNVDAEGFDVYISMDGISWIKVGSCIFNDSGRSYASIDISGHSGAFGYVKVVDCWTEPWTGSTTGADIDAIEGLHTNAQQI